MNSDKRSQFEVCAHYGAEPAPPDSALKVGIALSTLGQYPLNGLRHTPERGTSGWFLWCGEQLSDSPDFFQPLHIDHLAECCPEALPFLALPPGWRFLVAADYEDVWLDVALLAT